MRNFALCPRQWFRSRGAIVLFFLSAILLCHPSRGASAVHGPGEVLLVYNAKSPTSTAIARYYAAKRGITNILPVMCVDAATSPVHENIPLDSFTSQIANPVAAWLSRHPGINFIVLTKGVPIRIGGTDLAFIRNGAHTGYHNIDLTGDTAFTARVASIGGGGTIEVHVDSPDGKLIGSCAVPATGGYQSWTTATAPITSTSGVHDIYLVFKGGDILFNIEWFQFNGGPRIAATDFDESAGKPHGERCIEGGTATTGSETIGQKGISYNPSVDSYLAAIDYPAIPGALKSSITGSGATGYGWINRYYNARVPFSHAAFGGYLVTRLDAYTEAEALGLVDKALAAEQNPPGGPVLLDSETDFGTGDKAAAPVLKPVTLITREADWSTYNADVLHAADILRAHGIPCDLDNSNRFAGHKSGLMGYYSFGSNDDHYSPAAYESLYFAPGAIGDTAVSTSARTFLPTSGGQSLIADLIAHGITGVQGYSDEPLLDCISSPSIDLAYYFSGYTLAESFYAGTRYVGWENVTIGDPLCCPFPAGKKLVDPPATYCNPLDLNYRFQLSGNSRREAADPTMVRFEDEYWLFASKSGGYWHSKDMTQWTFVAAEGLPLEDYAPTVEIIGGQMYFTAFDSKAIYTTTDPAAGKWTKVSSIAGYGDPDLFADDDGRVYMYSGCSSTAPLHGVELDPKRGFAEIGKPVNFFAADPIHHGWELKNLFLTDAQIHAPAFGGERAYVEGAWMTKYRGTYYLQYAAPGTEKRWYADGVYLSDRPLGPFHYVDYNPVASKPAGFVCGTGHGSTFQDGQGHYWHIDSAIVGRRANFERRLAMFPAGFIPSRSGPDEMVCQTYLCDYPQYLPGGSPDPLTDNRPGWMLLSYHKAATASSTLPGYPAGNAFDEDIATWWSAATGNPGEWLSVDLGKRCEINAIQMNFADQDSTSMGRSGDAYRYVVDVSDDGSHWRPCISRKDNTRDAPHEYVQLEIPVTARYVRLTNVHTPGNAKFSLSGFRIFGSGLGKPPAEANGVAATRLPDRRLAKVTWQPAPGADFYIVRYGNRPDRLYLNHQVYGRNDLDLPGLNTDADYYVAVDTINDSGITMGTKAVPVR